MRWTTFSWVESRKDCEGDVRCTSCGFNWGCTIAKASKLEVAARDARLVLGDTCCDGEVGATQLTCTRRRVAAGGVMESVMSMMVIPSYKVQGLFPCWDLANQQAAGGVIAIERGRNQWLALVSHTFD